MEHLVSIGGTYENTLWAIVP
ncbi:MAG: hypothetical protein JWL99_867, partial [Streptomyces oryziradicis]|nr:hypothetical protein [Actinacidiphila oryziradicis]